MHSGSSTMRPPLPLNENASKYGQPTQGCEGLSVHVCLTQKCFEQCVFVLTSPLVTTYPLCLSRFRYSETLKSNVFFFPCLQLPFYYLERRFLGFLTYSLLFLIFSAVLCLRSSGLIFLTSEHTGFIS